MRIFFNFETYYCFDIIHDALLHRLKNASIEINTKCQADICSILTIWNLKQYEWQRRGVILKSFLKSPRKAVRTRSCCCSPDQVLWATALRGNRTDRALSLQEKPRSKIKNNNNNNNNITYSIVAILCVFFVLYHLCCIWVKFTVNYLRMYTKNPVWVVILLFFGTLTYRYGFEYDSLTS